MGLLDGFKISLDSIRKHKLRSALTLIGIIIGVASIIGIMTAIDAIQTYMEDTLSVLGTSVFQVQKMPAVQIGHNDRSKYRNRKDIKVEHADAIRDRATFVSNVGAEDWMYGRSLRYKNEATDPVLLLAGGTVEFSVNNGYFVEEGRFLTEIDVDLVKNVIVLGKDAVESLFPFTYPVGEIVKLEGRRFEVIGVLEEQGNQFGQSRDNILVIPLTYYQKMYGKDGSINITIAAKSPEVLDDAIEEVITILRTERKLSPGKDNDFEIFNSASLIETWNDLSRSLKIGSVLISFISLAVAGIGIMNIMMVSVTERTKEIGIRKALGARRRNILFQFLVEAVLLSLIGGIIGVVVGVLLGNVVAAMMNLDIAVPWFWVFIGLGFCTLVGIVFGIWPAAKASRLDPIESLRYE